MRVNEIEFLENIFDSMGANKNFVEKLNFFHETMPWRWENWLQMELVFHLNMNEIYDLGVESIHRYDQRHNLIAGNTRAQVDVVYRRNRELLNQYTAIELKINNNTNSCVKSAFKDMTRLTQTKSQEFNFRGVFSVLIFSHTPDEILQSIVTSINGKFVKVGSFQVLIIGWQASNKQEMGSRTKFKQWVDKFKMICDEKDFNLDIY